METAVVVRGHAHVRRDWGAGTSHDAEWLALIEAVELASELGLAEPVFLGDSLAVVTQANNTAPAPYAEALAAWPVSAGPLRIRHVKRTQNLAGIALARLHER